MRWCRCRCRFRVGPLFTHTSPPQQCMRAESLDFLLIFFLFRPAHLPCHPATPRVWHRGTDSPWHDPPSQACTPMQPNSESRGGGTGQKQPETRHSSGASSHAGSLPTDLSTWGYIVIGTDCAPSVLKSNPNVSASTYRSTALPRARPRLRPITINGPCTSHLVLDKFIIPPYVSVWCPPRLLVSPNESEVACKSHQPHRPGPLSTIHQR